MTTTATRALTADDFQPWNSVEVEVDLEVPLRTAGDFQIGLTNIRATISAMDEDNWMVRGVALDAIRRNPPGMRPEWKLIPIASDDPLFLILLNAVVTHGTKSIRFAIDDALRAEAENSAAGDDYDYRRDA